MLLSASLLCALAPSLYDTPPAFDFYFRAPRKYFQHSRAVDLDGDGQVERIDLNSRHAQTLRISHASALMWSGVQPRVRPWCLRVGDVDGDGRQEIALGTFKATRKWPRPHRTLSFYSWDGRAAKPKWLGSRLTLPFREFHLLNVDADAAAELVAVERDLQARWSLAIYNWDEFGFALAKRHGAWQVLEVRGVTARRLHAVGDGRRIQIGASVTMASQRFGGLDETRPPARRPRPAAPREPSTCRAQALAHELPRRPESRQRLEPGRLRQASPD